MNGCSPSRPFGLPRIICFEPQKGLDAGPEDKSRVIKSTPRHGSPETRRLLDPQPVRHSSPGWARPLTGSPSWRCPPFSAPRQGGRTDDRRARGRRPPARPVDTAGPGPSSTADADATAGATAREGCGISERGVRPFPGPRCDRRAERWGHQAARLRRAPGASREDVLPAVGIEGGARGPRPGGVCRRQGRRHRKPDDCGWGRCAPEPGSAPGRPALGVHARQRTIPPRRGRTDQDSCLCTPRKDGWLLRRTASGSFHFRLRRPIK